MAKSKTYLIATCIAAMISALNVPAEEKEQEPTGEALQTIEIIQTGADINFASIGVGCSPRNIEFDLVVALRGPGSGRAKPSQAQFALLSHPTLADGLRVVPVSEGLYRASVTVWDHVHRRTKPSGRTKTTRERGRAKIEVALAGCQSKTFNVDHENEAKRVVLRCKERET